MMRASWLVVVGVVVACGADVTEEPSTSAGPGSGGSAAQVGGGGSGGSSGDCDAAAFVGGGIADDGWGEGDYCDGIDTCVPEDVVPLLQQVVTTIDCSPDASCGGSATHRCTVAFAGEVQPDLMAELCAATLIEDVDEIVCLVLGP